MAQLNRLLPPNLAGTLPSFYTDSKNGTTKLVVPFTMNSAVRVSEVAGFALRIKTTTTDTLVAIEQATIWDTENFTVTFSLAATTVAKLVTGNFYKVQLAYFNRAADTTPYIGFYSTASIVKYTNEPSVGIEGLDSQTINSIMNRYFTGIYLNNDISEKVYEYRFILKSLETNAQGSSTTQVVEDTNWTIHDSSQDTELGRSNDLFIAQATLTTGRSYLLTYSIRTINGLEINSAIYTITSMANIGILLPFELFPELDYDNGRIKLHARATAWRDPNVDDPYEARDNQQANEHSQKTNPELWAFNGSYAILRTDSNSNYNVWSTMYTFQSAEKFADWEYIDYTVESGISYKYGIEKINNQNIKSRRVESEPVTAFFEFMFLYDGEKQIKLSFNANVNSFKTVISEVKKTTIGRKYPVIMRNGALNYKEFTIGGLLTYLSDNEELFISKDELIAKDSLINGYQRDNGRLDHLADVFIDTTDLTDRNITAERVFCLEVLAWLNNGKIKLFKSPMEGNYIVKLTNISLTPENTTGRMLHTFSATASEVAAFTFEELLHYDIIRNGSQHVAVTRTVTRYIQEKRMEYQASTQYDQAQVITYLSEWDWTEGHACTSIIIDPGEGGGQTVNIVGTAFHWGEYDFAVGPSNRYALTLDEPYEAPLYLSNPNGLNDTGKITMEWVVTDAESDERVDTQTVSTYYGWSGYGIDDLPPGNNPENDPAYQMNILYELSTLKRSVVSEYFMSIHTYPIIESASIGVSVTPEWWTDATNADIVQGYILLYDKWVLYHTNQTYYQYNGETLVPVDYSHMIYVKNPKLPQNATGTDVQAMQTGSILPEIDYRDSADVFLRLTPGVFTNLYYQIQESVYAIESANDVTYNSTRCEETYQEWCRTAFNLRQLTYHSEISGLSADTTLFIWRNRRFVPINRSEMELYQDYDWYVVDNETYSAAIIQSNRGIYRSTLAILNQQLKSKL